MIMVMGMHPITRDPPAGIDHGRLLTAGQQPGTKIGPKAIITQDRQLAGVTPQPTEIAS
ncbi:hypothetical protein [Actinoplanes campanulatus]|uniref:hypothetical protein n=1 Tax=Actinoplanes campanulatus TaxID=113559 RepID=UPI001953CC02|nr:hypothetical protein [Actinoplanes capillaceus]